jgi:gliding motility-associated-like protein
VKDTTLCFENAADNFEPQIIPILPKILNKTADATYITVWRDEKEEIIGTSDTLFVTRPGTYSLKVMALFKDKLCGENVNLTTKVNELCPPRIFVPDGFTPNGDGLNDRFKVFGRHVFEFKMQVYNRWNELVYEIEADKIEDITEEAWWDGTYRGALAPDGQYVWVMTYSTETDKEREKIRTEGAFVIVR